MTDLEAANKAHDHYDRAVAAMGSADHAHDTAATRLYLDTAKVELGLARLCLELRGADDTRAVK